jgi:ATP-binding cassette subfamily B protein
MRSLLGVLAFLAPYPVRSALCIALLSVNISIEMTLPRILGDTINDLQTHAAARDTFSPAPAVTLFLALVIVRMCVGFILGPLRNRLIQQTLGDIRSRIYDTLQRLSFGYHDRSNTGELISRSTTDVWRMQDFFFACLFLSIDILVALAATLVLIFHLSTLIGLLTIGTMLPTLGLIAFYAGKLQPQWRKVQDLHGTMSTVIQENVAGVRVVKAFAREQSEIEKFRGRREDYLKNLFDAVNYWAARVPFAQFIFGLSVPLALWVGGREVIAGHLQLGDLAKIILYLMAIGHRLGMVGQFTNILQNAGASAERIMEIIREPHAIRSGSRALPAGGGAVEMQDVSFQYRDAKPALRKVRFGIHAGQTVAVAGPTGSGKSTLVNLIPRFYDPTEGRVLIDGVDARELDLAQLRRAVGVIFQETFLFSATVAENIAFGKPDATREEIETCARAAQAHEFIEELEDGYDTVIGERGVSLSGGQRQRLAIARAFLMKPRILILDDATASVDSQTERKIQEAMAKLCAGRTTFIIAQRLSTVQRADVILVLKDGEIVERGTHAGLLAHAGFYREVFEQQIRK